MKYSNLGRILKLFLYLPFTVFISCQEDAELTYLRSVNFDQAPEIDNHLIVLTEDNFDSEELSVSWGEVDFHLDAPVTFSIQFTVISDTTFWEQAHTVEVGNNRYQKSFTGLEINEIASYLGLEPNEQHNMALRVSAFVNRPVFSYAVPFLLTPFEAILSYPSLWVPGEYQGWDPSTAPQLVSKNSDGIYEGYFYLPDGGSMEFKLTAQPDWEPMAYGDGGDGVLIEANFPGANFSVSEGGYYLFLVDLNEMVYQLKKTEWGIIGGATLGGWENDTEMSFDPVSQTWNLDTFLTTDGSFKFRANRNWELDFGIDENGQLAYANHPWLPYNDQPQISVTQSGNHRIILNLSDPENYHFELIQL
ncbi:SusE domain-containing protein [Arthrospiribacter ruber]|uniref:SusE outer membrane protein domain-containing protein n=1 Tax=Arthrospiribacter ruber TaxID=2487934 RepID=A0A951IWR9_9BACT|nr:SusE domain-containing protein [Arthrospiribacter ruber]MBW3467043.1 hypothetical protein [Arthrospiribacter ruber]